MHHLSRNLYLRDIVDNTSGLREKLIPTETSDRLQSTQILLKISCTPRVETRKRKLSTTSNISKHMVTMLLESRDKEITSGRLTLKVISLAMERRDFLTEQPSLSAQRELKGDSQRLSL